MLRFLASLDDDSDWEFDEKEILKKVYDKSYVPKKSPAKNVSVTDDEEDNKKQTPTSVDRMIEKIKAPRTKNKYSDSETTGSVDSSAFKSRRKRLPTNRSLFDSSSSGDSGDLIDKKTPLGKVAAKRRKTTEQCCVSYW